MTAAKAFVPGRVSLAEWRAIYSGCPRCVDPVARADVEAGRAALAEAGPLPWPVTGREGPTVAEFLGGAGDPLPAGVVRLLMALKIGVLGQGLTGVGWPLVDTLSECLSRDILPAIPVDGLSDRMAHAHLFALVTGTGEVLRENLRRPAAKALKTAGLAPCKLTGRDRQALLSGTTLSLAFALAGVFEAERVFRNALLAGALSAAAGRLPGAILHPRVHRLLRQPGQQEVAHVLRVLASAAATVAPNQADGAGAGGSSRQFSAEMGACLDLLRQAAATLERAANAAAPAGQLVFWQTDELVEGLDDISSLTFAADQVALALREIGALAERRIGALAEAKGPARSGAAGDVMAAGFSRDINDRARPTGFATDAEPDYPLVSVPAAARLLRVAGAASLVVVIELIQTARALGDAPMESMGELSPIRELLREAAPGSQHDTGVAAAELTGVAELVRSERLTRDIDHLLPGVIGAAAP